MEIYAEQNRGELGVKTRLAEQKNRETRHRRRHCQRCLEIVATPTEAAVCLRERDQEFQRALRRHPPFSQYRRLTHPAVADATAGRSSALGESLARTVARQIKQPNAYIPASHGWLKSASSE